MSATAGSPAKRSLLRSLGAQHVVDSRSADFASHLALTGGVDVVLNSLTSPGMVAGSVAGVRPGGRFVEISKRDIWSPARLAQDRPDVSYSLLAVDFLPPSAVHSALTRAAQAVSTGSFCPLPQVTHALQDAQAALRQMTQARHVGKVVVRCSPSQHPASQSHGRWVVTGGLGSLGSLVTSWLIQHGVEELLLTGRIGKMPLGNTDLVQLLRSTGQAAMVAIVKSDLAKEEEARMHCPLTASLDNMVSGIVHASGALADATVQKQTLAGVRTVFAAKLSSIQKLQSALAAQPITTQVLFSSVAALLGSAGQANYSAANGALDGLAAQWSAQGKAGVSSVQWGGWAGGGMASTDAGTAARLARMGMPLITPSQGLAALSGIINSQSAPSVLAAVPFNWDRFLQQGDYSRQAMFSHFARHTGLELPASPQPLVTTKSTHVVDSGAYLTAAQQAGAIVAAVQSTVSIVLGSPVSASAPLMAAGLDSLGMVELRNALQTKLGLQLPSTLVFDYPTANDIAAYVMAQLLATSAAASQGRQSQAAQLMMSELLPVDQQHKQQPSVMAHTQTTDVTPVVQEVVAGVLGVAPAGDTPLMAAGLDSLGMVEVRNALQTRLGVQLPSTLLFDYPTVEAISVFIGQKLASALPEPQLQPPAVVPQALSLGNTNQQQEGLAPTLVVTALVIATPQSAFATPTAVDTVTMVPISRWDVESAPEGLFAGPAVRFGSYLHNPAAFDAAAFGTSDTEAMYMDPQQRMLLQSAAEALGSSQLLSGSFPPNVGQKVGASVGVFVGVSSSDYEKLVMKHVQGVTAYTATGRAASVISGRLSYTFSLKGPSLTVDTACSSSLVSLHMAFNSLTLQQCTAACNSGVNVMITPETPAAFQKAGMLSADGRCKTLDSTAAGYVRAEGCGSMVLQHASAVEGCAVVAVFRGSAVNQDGRSSSLTAPNGPSQQGVIRQALQESALEPHQIHALQMHGTGM